MSKKFIPLERIQGAIDDANAARLAEYLTSMLDWDARKLGSEAFYIRTEAGRLLDKLKADPSEWDGRVRLWLNKISYIEEVHKLMMDWKLSDEDYVIPSKEAICTSCATKK
jgi:hypothetical protein